MALWRRVVASGGAYLAVGDPGALSDAESREWAALHRALLDLQRRAAWIHFAWEWTSEAQRQRDEPCFRFWWKQQLVQHGLRVHQVVRQDQALTLRQSWHVEWPSAAGRTLKT